MKNKRTLKIYKRDIGFNFEYLPFWDGVISGGWEPETYEAMDRFLDKEHSYIDIGAWIGPTVLYGAQKAKICYAFEPDPVAFAELERNVKLNPDLKDKIVLYNQAIGPGDGIMMLGARGELGDSMTSILWDKDRIEVRMMSLPSLCILEAIDDLNFIKIDIEGGEKSLLPSIKGFLNREKRPTLHLSLHSDWFGNKEEYFAPIIDTLSIYKNIYNIKGEKIALEDVRKLEGFTAIIASDK